MSDGTVEKVLTDFLNEAVELRYGEANDPEGYLRIPDYEDGPEAFARALLRGRARADRIEELLLKAKRAKGILATRARVAADEAQDKLDEALAEGSRNKVEFSAAVERKAEANLKSFAELRAQRNAARTLAFAEEVVDSINTIHWGLNSWRADVRDILKTFQLESNLER